MRFKEIEEMLLGACLVDVLFVGLFDTQEVPNRFHVSYRSVWFDFDEFLVQLSVIDDQGTAKVSVVKNVDSYAGLEDGEMSGLVSVQQQIVQDPDAHNEVAAVELWDPSEASDEVVCGAFGLELRNQQKIFVDPSYYFGIVLGGAEQEGIWRANHPTGRARRTTVR